MVVVILGMLACLVLSLVVIALVAVPARRYGEPVLVPKGVREAVAEDGPLGIERAVRHQLRRRRAAGQAGSSRTGGQAGSSRTDERVAAEV